MRVSDKDKKDLLVPEEKAAYPYGLRIHLEAKDLEKIGMSGTPEVGVKYMMMAEVEVVSVAIDTEKGDSKEFNTSLQITEMELKEAKAEEKSADAVIYGA